MVAASTGRDTIPTHTTSTRSGRVDSPPPRLPIRSFHDRSSKERVLGSALPIFQALGKGKRVVFLASDRVVRKGTGIRTFHQKPSDCLSLPKPGKRPFSAISRSTEMSLALFNRKIVQTPRKSSSSTAESTPRTPLVTWKKK